jgi:nucleotide-binding universal stress UspA family protein
VSEPQHVLVPVDFSKASVWAARYAIQLTGRWSPTVELLHVVDLPALVTPYPLAQLHGHPPFSLEEWARGRALDAMHQLVAALGPEVERVAGRYALRLVQRIETGHPASSITRVAAADAFDLIVLATHGRLYGRMPPGSIARHVLRHAPCPVIAVPPSPRRPSLRAA